MGFRHQPVSCYHARRWEDAGVAERDGFEIR
jgi:hypothetical protein